MSTGCASTQGPKEQNTAEEGINIEKPKEETISIGDYFPFVENTKMEYEGIGNEFARANHLLNL